MAVIMKKKSFEIGPWNGLFCLQKFTNFYSGSNFFKSVLHHRAPANFLEWHSKEILSLGSFKMSSPTCSLTYARTCINHERKREPQEIKILDNIKNLSIGSILIRTSVTRLGHFETFLVTNFLAKVTQVYEDILCYFEKINFQVKSAVSTFYFCIWSHCSRDLGSGYCTVGRAVASNTRRSRFESSH